MKTTIKLILLTLLFLFDSIFYSSKIINKSIHAQSLDNSKTSNSEQEDFNPLFEYFNNFIELGLIQSQKSTKEKRPEDLGSVLKSIRISNQYLSNNIIFTKSDLEVNSKPKRKISYTIQDKKNKGFFNIDYRYYKNELEYRKYYDTSENYTLDSYFNNYKEIKYKFGFGPLDYFEDSMEVSLYIFQMESYGSYSIQSRMIPQENIGLVYSHATNLIFYNYLFPTQQYYTQNGTLKIYTDGWGMVFGFNTKFFRIFSIYQIFDMQFFSVRANLSIFSPNVPFYNQQKKSYDYATQVLSVKKNLDFNINFYYELGFSITINRIGFKIGTYLTMPLILDSDYLKPKGYIIYLSNPIQIEKLENNIAIFYKGDPANQSNTFSLGIGGITFGFISKF